MGLLVYNPNMIILPLFSDWALLALRVILGIVFILHGWPKLRNWKGTTAWFGSVGFKPGWLWGSVAGVLEFFGGIALILGFRTRLVALLFVLQFLTIILWQVLRKNKFVGGWELDLIILGAALVLMTAGGGLYSFAPYSTWLGF